MKDRILLYILDSIIVSITLGIILSINNYNFLIGVFFGIGLITWFNLVIINLIKINNPPLTNK
jgi:hypothetical protein